jgi:lipopolysaccharide transport system ATP-binding protein
MKVRLGFAIAAQMEPDVLIIDEVLAVGDTGFKIKCFNRIAELKEKCAVIFVSHSMPQVSRICNKAIYMSRGRMQYNGDNMTQAVEAYYNSFGVMKSNNNNEYQNIIVNKIEVTNQLRKTPINHNDDLVLNLNFEVKHKSKIEAIGMIIVDQDYKSVASSICKIDFCEKLDLDFIIPNIQLGMGNYNISLQFFKGIDTDSRGMVLDFCQNITSFRIVNSPLVTAASFQLLNKIKINNKQN